jgi:hypothetical protein
MNLTLNELLTLVGRLDDAAGFDTPRERFRRFLVEHVTGAQAARSLVEQCQYAPGDQHHRALRDVVIALGRGLGFEPRFASYQSPAGLAKPDGHWHSRRLDVLLEIRIDQTHPTDLGALTKAVSELAAASKSSNGRAIGLCVLTPLYASRVRIDDVQRTAAADSRVQVTTLRALLAIAAMAGDKRLSHEDVVRLLASGLGLDFIADVLERAGGGGGAIKETRDSEDTEALPPAPVASESRFWLATINADQGATPEEFVELVIGKRQIFGVVENGNPQNIAQPGDRLCLYIPGKGVVGHCQVRSIAQDATGLRDAHRFSKLLHLEDAVLHVNNPRPPEEEMQLRMRALRADRAAHHLTCLSEHEFTVLTEATGREAVMMPETAPESETTQDGGNRGNGEKLQLRGSEARRTLKVSRTQK